MCREADAAPGIVSVKLRTAGALVALKLRELMAATALLAEALQLTLAHEGREPDVHIADAVAEVIRAKLADIARAVFNLQGRPQGDAGVWP